MQERLLAQYIAALKEERNSSPPQKKTEPEQFTALRWQQHSQWFEV